MRGEVVKSKFNIMIVDDDVMFANSLSELLEEEGYNNVVVNSGKEAIKKIKETDFNVVFLDIKMPVMNGAEALKEIKAIKPETTVIMMTGYSLEELVKEALSKGAHDILHKPLDIKKMLGIINAIMCL